MGGGGKGGRFVWRKLCLFGSQTSSRTTDALLSQLANQFLVTVLYVTHNEVNMSWNAHYVPSKFGGDFNFGRNFILLSWMLQDILPY